MSRSILVALALVVGALGACTAETGPYGTYGPYAVTTGPGYVSIGPGLSFVPGYGEPLFYDGNDYWLYRRGGWYVSPYTIGGWHYARHVPYRISAIRNPYMYMNYHAARGYYRYP